MRKKETVERNIGLTFDFLRQVLKDPSILDEIPNGSVIDFVEKDYPKIEPKSSVRPDKYLKVTTHFELIGTRNAYKV